MTHKTMLSAFVLVGATACAPVATLSGRWVFLAEREAIAVGQADQPVGGGPLHLLPGSPAGGACLSEGEYDSAFGERCEHEPEGASPEAEKLVRWYCGGKMALRVRFDRCEQPDRFKVAEIAVATD